jgi:hypothetical protein
MRFCEKYTPENAFRRGLKSFKKFHGYHQRDDDAKTPTHGVVHSVHAPIYAVNMFIHIFHAQIGRCFKPTAKFRVVDLV